MNRDGERLQLTFAGLPKTIYCLVFTLSVISLSTSDVRAQSNLAVYGSFVQLYHLSNNPFNTLPNNYIRIGVAQVVPSAGTTGTASVPVQGPFSLGFSPNPFDNQFQRIVVDTPARRGPWTLSFTNPSYPQYTSPPLTLPSGAQQVPFVQSISISGSSSAPTFQWTPPPGTAVNGYRVNIYDLNSNFGSGGIFSRNLLPNVTSINLASFPGVPALAQNGRYSIEISALQTRDGLSNDLGNPNVYALSRVYANFTPLPAGSPQVNLPVAQISGSYVFNIAVAPGVTYYLDPAISTGYIFQTGVGDPNFASVILPMIQASYQLAFDVGGTLFNLMLAAGQQYFFPTGGVSRFDVLGINPLLGLDPTNPTAFITGVTFTGTGSFTGTQTPIVTNISAVPTPVAGANLAGLLVIAGTLFARHQWRRPAI